MTIIEWLSELPGGRVHVIIQAPLSRQDASPAASLPTAEIKQMMLQEALPLTSDGFGRASELAILTAERLAKDHTRLASGDGALRLLATALVGIRGGNLIEASRTQATRLPGQSVGGIAPQRQGTAGGAASQYILSTNPEQLREIAVQPHTVMNKVVLLHHAVESEVKGEPVNKAPADGLVEHFGLGTEQRPGEHPDGPYSNAEAMVLGPYTSGEYQHLSRPLRQGRELDAGRALIDRGMSAAFEKSGPAGQVVKTFRGIQDRDAFEAMKEGQVGRDAGYPSISRDPGVVRSFAGQGTITTLFGRSGVGINEIPIEGDEQEILYDKGTSMCVLLSAKDEQSVTCRVLEEATLGERSGYGEGLLDALNLTIGTDHSGKPQEQDLRLRMRGLDLARSVDGRDGYS